MVKGVLDYDKLSRSYDELYKEEQVKKLELIKKHIKIIPPLLDVGCGTGISTNYFNVESVGIDSSREMIKQGKGNLIYARAEHLPFEDNSFNTVISVSAFHNFKNMGKSLKEILRVSSNSNIAISFLKKSGGLPIFRSLIKNCEKVREFSFGKEVLFVIS